MLKRLTDIVPNIYEAHGDVQVNKDYIEVLEKIMPKFHVYEYTSSVETSPGHITWFPNQYYHYACLIKEYAMAFNEYLKVYSELLALGEPEDLMDNLDKVDFIDNDDKQMFRMFVMDSNYRQEAKNIWGKDKNGELKYRTDYDQILGSALLKILGWTISSSGYFGTLVYALLQNPQIYNELENNITQISVSNDLSLEELGNILREMYESAKDGRKVTSIHMFGILYGQQIKNKNYSQTDIISLAGLQTSYSAELNKGINIGEELRTGEYEIIEDGADKRQEKDTLPIFEIKPEVKFEIPDIFFDSFAKRYIKSLLAKPFAILAGNSGTGKTRIAIRLAKYLEKKDSNNKNWLLVPVGADWTDNTHILGYYNPIADNGKGTYVKSEILKFIELANANPEIPFFLILDEMNLSHVERYFSDFLSLMEDPDPNKVFTIDGYGESLLFPKNLFLTGTVNIDETTYMFSPKVLDRANVLEFKPSIEQIMDYFTNTQKNEEAIQKRDGVPESFLQIAMEVQNGNCAEAKEWIEKAKPILMKINSELYNHNYEFAFRTAREICQYLTAAYKLCVIPDDKNLLEAIDEQVQQKILPKIHGNKKEIATLLNNLKIICNENKLSGSEEKISQMIDKLETRQYASFI